MRTLLALSSLALASCSSTGHEAENAGAYDPNEAATRAQGDIANYAAGTPRPEPAAAADTAAIPAVSPPTKADVPADGASSATDFVRRYYDLIASRGYAQAWALWSDNGAASGMNEAEFAASFDKYADYRATIGTPGAIDAGAGQRHIAVPVRIGGTLTAGGSFALAGDLILHRVADGIDTPDPADHDWRISQSSIKPRPADAAD